VGPVTVGGPPGSVAGWLPWGRLGEGTMMNPPVAAKIQPLNIKAQKCSQ